MVFSKGLYSIHGLLGGRIWTVQTFIMLAWKCLFSILKPVPYDFKSKNVIIGSSNGPFSKYSNIYLQMTLFEIKLWTWKLSRTNIPRKKLCNNWKIWGTSYCSHEENHIGMPDSLHDSNLAIQTTNRFAKFNFGNACFKEIL